jgi:hypothetical protein
MTLEEQRRDDEAHEQYHQWALQQGMGAGGTATATTPPGTETTVAGGAGGRTEDSVSGASTGGHSGQSRRSRSFFCFEDAAGNLVQIAKGDRTHQRASNGAAGSETPSAPTTVSDNGTRHTFNTATSGAGHNHQRKHESRGCG